MTEIRVGRKDLVLIISLAYSLLYDPLYFYILHFDGARRSVSLAFSVALSYILIRSRQDWKLFFKTPLVFWFIWVVYNYINTIIHGLNESTLTYVSLSQQLLLPLIGFFIAKNVDDKIKLVKAFFICGIIYLILFMVFEEPNPGDKYRLGAFINSNEAGWILILTYLCGLILFNRKGSILFIILTIALLGVIIVLGSRKTFFVFLFIAASYYVFLFNFPRMIFTRAILAASIVVFLWLSVIADTHLGVRVVKSMHENEASTKPEQMFSNRAYFYIMGFKLFKQEPLTGIGLENFVKKTRTDERIHSEYMVNLTEGGFIGTIFFVLFYFFLIRAIITMEDDYYLKRIKILAILSFFIIFLGRWNYSHYQSFIFLAMISSKLRDLRYE